MRDKPSKSSVGLGRYMRDWQLLTGSERTQVELAYLAGFSDGCEAIAEIYRLIKENEATHEAL